MNCALHLATAKTGGGVGEQHKPSAASQSICYVHMCTHTHNGRTRAHSRGVFNVIIASRIARRCDDHESRARDDGLRVSGLSGESRSVLEQMFAGRLHTQSDLQRRQPAPNEF